jgi:tetratricopeptide (TPR) repeat protein
MGYVENSLGMYEEARTWFERALFTNRECGNLFGEAKALTSLGLLFYHQNDYPAAHKACGQAYDFTRQLGDRVLEAEALTAWGHVYAAQDETIEAAAAYQKALELRQELGQRDQGVEATAGLVHLALKEEASVHALPFVEKILDYMRFAGNLKVTQQPLWVDLVCYRALSANDDPRASQVLERAYNTLMSQVKNLENGAERKSFLSNVVSHREIVKLYEQNSIRDSEKI